MKKTVVKFKSGRTSIYLKKGIFPHFAAKDCALRFENFFIVSSNNLIEYAGRLKKAFAPECHIISFEDIEQNKERKTKERLEDQLLDLQIRKNSCIIALGGGVVSDMAGIIAHTLLRGVGFVIIPTTLLAMIDAAIGGKSGLNTPHGKNLIGAIYPPKAAYIDPLFLGSLDAEDIQNGKIEMIKHELIMGNTRLKNLEKEKISDELIWRNVLIKKSIVEQDNEDLHLRKILNFGHTVGHALEKAANFNCSHGFAVAIGMLVESWLSLEEKLIGKREFLHIKKIIQKSLKNRRGVFEKEKFLSALSHDKKRTSQAINVSLIRKEKRALFDLFFTEEKIWRAVEEIFSDKTVNITWS